LVQPRRTSSRDTGQVECTGRFRGGRERRGDLGAGHCCHPGRSLASGLRTLSSATRNGIPEASRRGAGFRTTTHALAPAAGVRIFGAGAGRRKQGGHRKQQRRDQQQEGGHPLAGHAGRCCASSHVLVVQRPLTSWILNRRPVSARPVPCEV
jgi:hypothetical protein